MSLPVRAEPVEARTESPFDKPVLSGAEGLRVTGDRLPAWLRRPLAIHGQWARAKGLVEELKLHTVCEEARCPNLGECWSHGNVSFMILGDRCTRRCHFCSVTTARGLEVDPEEPRRLAEAVARLGLAHAVITSVARDDLPDEGAGMFAECVRAVRERCPGVAVEVLTPDFHARPALIREVVESGPEVFNHNVETVERLSRGIRPQADYRRSLEVLRLARELGRPGLKTKSGLMVGLGERPEEVRQTLRDLREAGCGILTIGQYLRPTLEQREVEEFVPPEQFELYGAWGRQMGFSSVASAPYVRSSYNAFEALRER
ncbi:MAG: lipoyl synthase [Candidatus Omnitrophica bacterium]|nr:lipoyl synthase [Candidatus Omnitrophota bacterium]